MRKRGKILCNGRAVLQEVNAKIVEDVWHYLSWRLGKWEEPRDSEFSEVCQ